MHRLSADAHFVVSIYLFILMNRPIFSMVWLCIPRDESSPLMNNDKWDWWIPDSRANELMVISCFWIKSPIIVRMDSLMVSKSFGFMLLILRTANHHPNP